MVKYLVVGAPVTVGVVGISAYLAWPPEENISSRIRSSISGKDYLKLVESRDSGYWNKFKELYKNFKGEKLDGVSEATLPSWCEKILKSKISSRTQREIDFSKKWCVVDTRNLKKATQSLGKILVSDLPAEEQDGEYKKAWDYYRDNKGSKKMIISDDTFTRSEKTTSVDGGPALKVWCTSKENTLMYEYGGEDKVHEKYMTWCVKRPS